MEHALSYTLRTYCIIFMASEAIFFVNQRIKFKTFQLCQFFSNNRFYLTYFSRTFPFDSPYPSPCIQKNLWFVLFSRRIKKKHSLRKIRKFHLIFWSGNFAETRFALNSAEIVRFHKYLHIRRLGKFRYFILLLKKVIFVLAIVRKI